MTEAEEQRQFVKWFRATYPDHAMALRVSQSGAYRGKGRRGAIRTAQAQGQGAIKGEADIVILRPSGAFPYMVIEHKGEGQAHKLTAAQQDYLAYHEAQGAMAISTRGLDALRAAVATYMGR